MKKLFYCIVALILSLSVGFAGCKKKSQESETNGNEYTSYVGKGIHTATVSERSEAVIKTGTSDYAILLPCEYKNYEYKGASLLQKYLYYATGVSLPIITEDSLQDGQDKVISVGDTELLHQSGLSFAYSVLGDSGFKIKTMGSTVFISGARSNLRYGTYLGCQEYLRYVIDWEAYTAEEIRYEKRTTVKLCDYDVVEVPDFNQRRISYSGVINDPNYVNLLGLNIENEEAIKYIGHSHFQIIPPSTYFETNPEWYYFDKDSILKKIEANGGTNVEEKKATYWTTSEFTKEAQLCLSNQALRDEVVKNLVKAFKENPETVFVHIGGQDNLNFCNCESCTAVMTTYNTNAAGLNVMFMNEVARRVTEEIQKTQPDRNITFEAFAYYATMEPPVHRDDNGSWVADAPEVIPDSNVRIQFTPLRANASEPMESEKNQEFVEYLNGWYALTNNISVWRYEINFGSYLYNHKLVDTLVADLRFYSDRGVTSMYSQGPIMHPYATMYEMKAWVQAKLMWNLSLDYNELVQEFVEVFYGEVSGEILEFLDLLYNWQVYANEELEMSGTVWLNLDNTKYYTFGYCESVRKIFVKAYEKLNALKENDREVYDRLYVRLGAAYLENMFMQLDLYYNNYSQEHLEETLDLFEAVVGKLGLEKTSENSAGAPKAYLSDCIKIWRSRNG